ncbi:MAG TPA: RHS repeat-associated core domain-containing protein, partial [Sphingobacteriaceae bacterium]
MNEEKVRATSSHQQGDTIGKKGYELNNHLGNVMAVISDTRTLVNGTYEADVMSAQDYYSFGSLQPGRHWSLGDGYRYGFNGKENDNEVKGIAGSQQDYGMRIYDPRLGRFLSLDPLASVYPAWTPYSFAMNRPIDGIDLDGAEFATVIKKYFYGSKKPVLEISWNDPNQHNSWGNRGQGILTRSEFFGKDGRMTNSIEKMYKRNSIGDHGFYCGPTQLPQVDLVRTYRIESIDAVDEAGRLHDMGY